MKIWEYAALLSLPLAFFAGSVHAETHSKGVQDAYQTECEILFHGDISTLDMAEYRARWNECLGEAKRADTSCDRGTAHHVPHDLDS